MMPRARGTRVEVDRRVSEAFGADYADAFALSDVADTPAAEWARLTFAHGLPLVRRVFGTAVWHGVLRFELAPAGPGAVAGWRVVEDTSERFVMDTDGPLQAGRIVFVTSPGGVTWTTMLRFHRPAAARVWAVAGHAHRVLAPLVLGRAGDEHRRSSAQAS